MLSQLLRAAPDEDVDAAGRLLHNPQSRAMYAVDLMLQSNDTPSGAVSTRNEAALPKETRSGIEPILTYAYRT